MEKLIKIISMVIYEDNRLYTRVSELESSGVEISGLESSGLFEVVATALESSEKDKDGATEEYYAFIGERRRTYNECETFLRRWMDIRAEALI
jgi:hypothetical protein